MHHMPSATADRRELCTGRPRRHLLPECVQENSSTTKPAHFADHYEPLLSAAAQDSGPSTDAAPTVQHAGTAVVGSVGVSPGASSPPPQAPPPPPGAALDVGVASALGPPGLSEALRVANLYQTRSTCSQRVSYLRDDTHC